MSLRDVEFGVVDVETTGLFPGGHDRICEIAVVRVRADGSVIDEYSTLVNPERDLGPTHLHEIRAADVRDAPLFAEIAGAVARLLDRAVFAAHNVSFDARFVSAEIRRAGHEVPPFPRVCTLRLAAMADADVQSRRLPDLCAHFGIGLAEHHSARADAHATAALLAQCLGRLDGSTHVNALVDRRTLVAWPSIAITAQPLQRYDAAARRDAAPSYIGTLVARLPAHRDVSPETTAYMDLLDRALEDRRITESEAHSLIELASMAGLSQANVVAAHETYLHDVVSMALADGVISDSEQRDLDEVRRALGIDAGAFEQSLQRGRVDPQPAVARSVSEDLQGKTICFTGTLHCAIDGERVDRAAAEILATNAGLVTRRSVSKKLDILVLADPDSMSGKARKARQLGVRLMSEAVFWRTLGIVVD